MLRIFLGIAILAGAGALGLTMKVDKKIKDITTERNQFETDKNTAQAGESKAKADAKKARDAKDAAEKVAKGLAEEKTQLEARVEQQEKRANGLDTQLSQAKQEQLAAQQELSAWKASGITVDKITTLVADLKKANETIGVDVEEKKVLLRNNNKLKNELARYTGENDKVELPAGLKGKVLAVDPKYDFVVLDIGSKQGVLERGELLVNRGGKLVAKVRILSVQSDRSIANVLQEYRQTDVLEGDQVFY